MSAYHVTSSVRAPQRQLHYDRRQLALMVKVAKFCGSDEQRCELKRLGALKYFNLQKAGRGFVWSFQA